MIYRTYQFVCDDCLAHQTFVGGISQARKNGWAIAIDRNTCYCPTCAPMYRNIGCKGQPRKAYLLR